MTVADSSTFSAEEYDLVTSFLVKLSPDKKIRKFVVERSIPDTEKRAPVFRYWRVDQFTASRTFKYKHLFVDMFIDVQDDGTWRMHWIKDDTRGFLDIKLFDLSDAIRIGNVLGRQLLAN